MHNDTLVRLVEDVGEPRTDVVEQTNRVSKEIGGSKDSVDLSHHLFLIVQLNPLYQRRHAQTRVLEEQRAEGERCGIDIAQRHCQDVEGVVERVSGGYSGGSAELNIACQVYSLLIHIHPVRPHERKLKLHGL